ncbi:hypothetical protein U1Q18_020779 [Sarracenia purpurea var. burkii]
MDLICVVRQHDPQHFQVEVAPPQPRHQQLRLRRARAALRREELHHHRPAPPLLCSSAVRSTVAFSKTSEAKFVALGQSDGRERLFSLSPVQMDFPLKGSGEMVAECTLGGSVVEGMDSEDGNRCRIGGLEVDEVEIP